MCGNSSCWAKIAVVVLLLAFIVDIIGFATTDWALYEITTQRIRVGLFKMENCIGTACTTGDVSDSTITDGNFNATQALEVILLIMLILAMIVAVIYLVLASLRTNCMAWAVIVMCFVACFCGFIGMICWLLWIEDPYIVGYSMGLTVLASILALIAGFLLFPDVMERAESSPVYDM